jgi:hypothetical protein
MSDGDTWGSNALTAQALLRLAVAVGVSVPGDETSTAEDLLELAQSQVEVALGQRISQEHFDALADDQQSALRMSVGLQALWLAELEAETLGPSDIAALGGEITFSRTPRPRLSPAVLELLALRGLIVRSGMARQPEPTP